MAKRPRGDRLTGGSGDVKPQLFALNLQTQSAADTSFSTAFNTPVPRITPSASKATIMEILKVYFTVQGGDAAHAAWCYLSTASVQDAGVNTLTAANGAAALSDPRVFAFMNYNDRVNTSGMATEKYPKIVDVTDGAGNGVLVATDQIFFEGSSDIATSAMTFGCKILYRVYDASILEYVGIVQSQQ